ncbi:hypothetical protein M513_04614 [Trichuris suis]|uniref:Uncharacterized protein n=1 Tax=Trichuris suis TaxID=68888 RepID=A0A085MB71_9BILA|nr:hypothetical protein M513_04614 [Trichuris suis]
MQLTAHDLQTNEEDVVFIGENVRWYEFTVPGQKNNGSTETCDSRKKFPNIISEICHNKLEVPLWRGELKIGPLLPLSVMLLPAFGNASRVADLLSNMMINCPNATPRECFLEYMEKCIDSEIMDVVVMRVVPDGNETIRYGIRFEMIKGWRFLHCAITDEMPLVAQMVVFPLTAHEELPALLNRLDRPDLSSPWQDGIYLFLAILKSYEHILLPAENCENLKRYEHQQFLKVMATPPSKHIREYYTEMMKHQKQLIELESANTSAQSSAFRPNEGSAIRKQRENRTMSTAYCSDENRTMNTECIPPKWDRYFRQRNYSAQKQVNNTPRVQRRRTDVKSNVSAEENKFELQFSDGTEVNLSVENLLDSFVFKPSSWRHRF